MVNSEGLEGSSSVGLLGGGWKRDTIRRVGEAREVEMRRIMLGIIVALVVARVGGGAWGQTTAQNLQDVCQKKKLLAKCG